MKTTSQKDNNILKPQKFLGDKGIIVFIALMNMFIPLSTDLYMPALPKMSAYFGSSSAITNLTLSAFFFFYALGILIWGPLSDKYGRKPILISGSIIYVISSIFCATSFSIYFLILSRIFQAIGAGGITSVSMALIKDCYKGKKRETILAIVQSMTGLAPMLAPIIGALILKILSWRYAFWLLATIGIINLALTFLFEETLSEDEKYTGTIIGSLGRLIIVVKNKSFFIPTVIFSLNALPFMGYLAISSYIYVDYFKLSAQVYSYFFAANALVSVLGPVIYMRYLTKRDKKVVPAICFGLALVSGLLIMTIGTKSPFLFVLPLMVMSLTGTAIRPYSTNVLLDQQKGDTGSAASIIGTSSMVLGSLGMLIVSISWSNIVIGLGAIIAFFSVLSLVSWYVFIKSSIPCIGIKDISQPLNRSAAD